MELFKNFEEVRELTAFPNVNNELETLIPYVNQAKNEYLPTIIGVVYFDALYLKYENDTLDAEQAKQWKAVQGFLAQYGYYLMSYDANIALDTDGLHRFEDATRKSAYQWQAKEFRELRFAGAFAHLHELMMLLAAASPEGWLTDKTRIRIEDLLLWKMTDWAKVRSLSNWFTFILLLPELKAVQQKNVKAILGAQYGEFLTQYKTNELLGDNQEVLDCIQAYMAHKAIAMKVDEVPMHVSVNGLSVMETLSNKDNTTQQSAMLGQEQAKFKANALARAKEAWCCLEKAVGITQTPRPVSVNEGGVFLL